MISNIHAGHGKQDSKSAGSSLLIKESIENRIVKDEVIRLLNAEKHTTYDTTVDYPSSQNDCLNKIVKLCNKHKTDLDISIHFNSAANDANGNGKTTGVECWVYDTNTKAKPYAERICKSISELGFTNRGVKYSKQFAVLKTNNPCLIIECCFVDDKDDVNLYDAKKMAKAIVEGILNKSVSNSDSSNETSTFIFKNGDYAGRKAIVTTNVLNVRYNRGTDYEVIGQVKKGQQVKLEWCQDKWISIQNFNGYKGLGYVHTDYLELI